MLTYWEFQDILNGHCGISDCTKYVQVEFHIVDFWTNLPLVQQRLIQNAKVCETLAVCDTYLYHTLMSILIPGTLNYIPTR